VPPDTSTFPPRLALGAASVPIATVPAVIVVVPSKPLLLPVSEKVPAPYRSNSLAGTTL
jgi:hypothetical protein